LVNSFFALNFYAKQKQEIRNSSHFLALLSSNAITKRGFVQKEINIALEVIDEIPYHLKIAILKIWHETHFYKLLS